MAGPARNVRQASTKPSLLTNASCAKQASIQTPPAQPLASRVLWLAGHPWAATRRPTARVTKAILEELGAHALPALQAPLRPPPAVLSAYHAMRARIRHSQPLRPASNVLNLPSLLSAATRRPTVLAGLGSRERVAANHVCRVPLAASSRSLDHLLASCVCLARSTPWQAKTLQMHACLVLTLVPPYRGVFPEQPVVALQATKARNVQAGMLVVRLPLHVNGAYRVNTSRSTGLLHVKSVQLGNIPIRRPR